MRGHIFRDRKIIYAGLGGRQVERVYGEAGESYILKPSQSPSREADVYQQVLPSFPDVYPKLLSVWEEEQVSWLLFEDLGELTHAYRMEEAKRVVQQMALWHQLPKGIMGDIAGHGVKPSYADMLADLLSAQAQAQAALPKLLGEQKGDWDLQALLAQIGKRALDPGLVVSHGDLHVGNYTIASGKLYILDWEHLHLSSRYWDLFHVLDLSHPLYPSGKPLFWREELLEVYLEESGKLGAAIDRQRFLLDYYQFAVVFSLWMLKLIASDLSSEGGPWTKEQLLPQQAETIATTTDLLNRYRALA